MPLQEYAISAIQKCEESIFDFSNAGLGSFKENVKEFIKLVAQNSFINHLILTHNNLEDEDAEALSVLEKITHLDLKANKLHNKSVLFILKNKNIVSLDLSRNGMIDNEIGQVLLDQSHLIYINLERTGICDKLCEEIYKHIKETRERKEKDMLALNQQKISSLQNHTSSNANDNNNNNVGRFSFLNNTTIQKTLKSQDQNKELQDKGSYTEIKF